MRKQRELKVSNSMDTADNILDYLNSGWSISKKLNFFVDFASSMAKDASGLTVYTRLYCACELVSDYLDTLKAYDHANESAYVKKAQKMELRAKLNLELQKCGPIGECLNNDKVIGGKYEKKNNLDKIDRVLIEKIFNLKDILYKEKRQSPQVDKAQLSEIEELVLLKKYDLALAWCQPVEKSDKLRGAITATLSPAPIVLPPERSCTDPLLPLSQPTKKAFNIFFLGTGERLEKDAKPGKNYKHTMLTKFQKIVKDSSLITGIAAGYGDYDKTDEDTHEIRKRRSVVGELMAETIGGEGHEASLRAARKDLDRFLAQNNINPNDTTVEINLVGFSRGAVSCIRFANRLRFIYPHLKVNIFAIDPVAGPTSAIVDDWEARNIPSNVGEYHAVHMQHVGGAGNRAYSVGFEPQDLVRLTVERPDKLIFSVDILPGVHGGAQTVRAKGMEEPTYLTAYNLHSFLQRHGAIIPAESIELAHQDRKTLVNFDYLKICAHPKQRLKMFEQMVNNEHLYSKSGSKVRTLNKELHRYHQNADFFLTQQHREDFKQVYPYIFYWFFEGGLKNQELDLRVKVCEEVITASKEEPRLFEYLKAKKVSIKKGLVSIPAFPLGDASSPEENCPYSNHETLSANKWLYYHPSNTALRLKAPISDKEINDFVITLDLASIVDNFQRSLADYIYFPNPSLLFVDMDKIKYNQARFELGNDLLCNMMKLQKKSSQMTKLSFVKQFLLIVSEGIVRDLEIRSRRGAHHITQIGWDIIEKNKLQTILDIALRENTQQKSIVLQQEKDEPTVPEKEIDETDINIGETLISEVETLPLSYLSQHSFWQLPAEQGSPDSRDKDLSGPPT